MTQRDGGSATVEADTVRLHIADMDCPSCVQKIQGHLLKLDGVLAADGSPVARTFTVSVNPERVSMDDVREEVGRLGYVARPIIAGAPKPERESTWWSASARVAYASLSLFAISMLLRLTPWNVTLPGVPTGDLRLHEGLLLASALVGGWNFFPKGVRSARALSLDMNFLMTFAILGAIAIGELTEAAAIAFLFAIAELLENYSVDRARASVEALMELAPDRARVVRDGREVTIPADEIVAGDVLCMRPGERLPADGVVEEGSSAVDQSPITGESIPVDKGPGDEVFSGTINRSGFLRVRASRPAAASALARIVQLVENAEAEKSETERFVERFARYYTPTVTIAAVVIMTVPALLFGADFGLWFVRGLTLLVIACPCALVISTPVAVVSGVTAAARQGVLIKGGKYLEAMGNVTVVAMDKTGTLTRGHPEVIGVHASEGMDEREALARAAAIEVRSEHPIATAIVDAARDRDARWGEKTVTSFEAQVGSGASAQLDGVAHVIGKPAALTTDAEARAEAARLARGGRTVVGLASEGTVQAWFVLADEPRDSARHAVQALKGAGIERIVMLTGDNQETAEAIGAALGVDEVRSELLPEQKVEAVQSLGQEHGAIAMVGDGVNDGPALAVATVGIAMGAAGSDTALETADIALMGDDLTRLPYLLNLAHRARRVIRQNIAAAITIKVVLAIGVPLGMISLVTAVIVGDMGVSLAVTLNALRLGRTAGP